MQVDFNNAACTAPCQIIYTAPTALRRQIIYNAPPALRAITAKSVLSARYAAIDQEVFVRRENVTRPRLLSGY